MQFHRTTLAAALALGACTGSDPAEPPDALAFSSQGPSVQFSVPEESPGPPFYSITGNGGFLAHDGEWTFIPFLRQPACIPRTQNLLIVAGPSAFGCALTVYGHEHWQNGPGIDPAPRQTRYAGLGAVPVVFARLDEVMAASAGGLQLAELLALPSARPGIASFYSETDILGISGPHGAGKGSYKITASGSFTNGGSFRVLVNEVLGELRVVRIRFGD